MIFWIFAIRYALTINKLNSGEYTWFNIDNYRRKLATVLALVPIFILMTLKGKSVGADTLDYYEYFKITRNLSLSKMFENRQEAGYQILVKALNTVFTDPQILFIITGLFFCISIGVFVYKFSKNQTVAVVFYITLGLFAFMMTGLRQGIAMCICLYSFSYIKEKKIFQFLLLIWLAYYFHTSALFFIPAYFIANMKVDIKNFLIFILIFGFVMYFGEGLLIKIAVSTDYEQYAQIERTTNGQIFFAIVAIITFFSLIYQKKILALNPYNYIFINLNYLNLMLWGLRLISRVAERPSLYYMFATVILFEQLVSSIDEISMRRTFYYGAIGLSLVLFFYRLNTNLMIVPYRFFWE
jgi:hypothetical protein